jgi:stromal membrane-associated protein
VQEKAKIDRSTAARQPSAPNQILSQRRPPPTIDLFGDDTLAPPVRPGTTDNAIARQQPKSAAPTTTRQTKQGDSLLGLDFFGQTPSLGPPRPSSASSNPLGSRGQSRPDLKQSILSLYSSAPKTQIPSSPHNQQSSLGAHTSPATSQSQDAFGGLTDALSGLNFSSSNPTTSPPPQAKPSFSQTSAFPPSMHTKSAPSAPQISSPQLLSGGGFFDSPSSKKSEHPNSKAPPPQKPPNGLDFAFVETSAATSKSNILASQDLQAGDRFARVESPAPPPVPPPTMVSSPSLASNLSSAFNLSARSAAPSNSSAPIKPPPVSHNNAAMFDPWSSANDSNAWSTPETTPAPSKPKVPSVDIGRPPAHITPKDISGGWGEPTSSSQKAGQFPSITADEDYGGWTSAPTNQTSISSPAKPNGGFTGASDPFDNPWG